MEKVYEKASVLYSTVATDGKEVALILFDEKRQVAGELICYKLSYCGDITEMEFLNSVNLAFQEFVMKYQIKIDMESLGKAKYRFDLLLLDSALIN